ncbi:hypothetical protein MRX96_051905 [Rhipicephalus microplus]
MADSAADDIVEDDDALRSIDFGSFLDTGAVDKRSTMSTTSVFVLQSEWEFGIRQVTEDTISPEGPSRPHSSNVFETIPCRAADSETRGGL